MDDEMNGATFPTKADRLFGPNPSGLDESPHGMMVLVFVGMFAGGQFGSRRQVVCGDGCNAYLRTWRDRHKDPRRWGSHPRARTIPPCSQAAHDRQVRCVRSPVRCPGPAPCRIRVRCSARQSPVRRYECIGNALPSLGV